MRELERRDELGKRLGAAKQLTRIAFSAAIAERLLPFTESSLTRWRKSSWSTFRRALDTIWDYLHGDKLEIHKYEELRQECYELVPHSEDPEFKGGIGAQEAAAVVVHTLDTLLRCEPKDALSSSILACSAISTFLVFQQIPEVRSNLDVDEEAIFYSEMMQKEVHLENKQLALLMECEDNKEDFLSALMQVRAESKKNPIPFAIK